MPTAGSPPAATRAQRRNLYANRAKMPLANPGCRPLCQGRGLARALSIQLEPGDMLVLGGMMRRGVVAAQSIAGVPVTARQVAKRSVLVSR